MTTMSELADWELDCTEYRRKYAYRYGGGVPDAPNLLREEWRKVVFDALLCGEDVPLHNRPDWAISYAEFVKREWGDDDLGRRLAQENDAATRKQYREIGRLAALDGYPVAMARAPKPSTG